MPTAKALHILKSHILRSKPFSVRKKQYLPKTQKGRIFMQPFLLVARTGIEPVSPP